MDKELSQMSLEELWDLFPIFLVAHDDRWDLFYSEIDSALKSILSDCPIERISHIDFSEEHEELVSLLALLKDGKGKLSEVIP